MSYDNNTPQYPQQGYTPQQTGYVQQPQYQGGIPPQQQSQQPLYSSTTQMNPQLVVNDRGNPTKEWKFGLLDCFEDCGLCLKTSCCPCITYGETKAKLNQDPDACLGHTLLYTCFHFMRIDFILGGLNRGEVRARHGIDGSACGDCLTHFCCNCCALIQEHRETHSN
ncbi:PLAC8 family-domain-containing protein [Glomus cerebriforme]|uniref:PLAC8 family-domain-containing protein n=1 Tax=Glomus cerebriforme TaxID=658196 RepID=A0A397S641_9GLOM|nr:PLAC8 family-domain-containing protein [Glomus cerebriforme]